VELIIYMSSFSLHTHKTNTWEYFCIIWETQPWKIQEKTFAKAKNIIFTFQCRTDNSLRISMKFNYAGKELITF